MIEIDANMTRPFLVAIRHLDPADEREAAYSSHDTREEAQAVADERNAARVALGDELQPHDQYVYEVHDSEAWYEAHKSHVPLVPPETRHHPPPPPPPEPPAPGAEPVQAQQE